MGVPRASERVLQPSVSVLAPVDEQWAACPRYTPPAASVKTKFPVHCPAPPRNDEPPVKVITPGWIVALLAGAHADAAAGADRVASASALATGASLHHSFIYYASLIGLLVDRARACSATPARMPPRYAESLLPGFGGGETPRRRAPTPRAGDGRLMRPSGRASGAAGGALSLS